METILMNTEQSKKTIATTKKKRKEKKKRKKKKMKDPHKVFNLMQRLDLRR